MRRTRPETQRERAFYRVERLVSWHGIFYLPFELRSSGLRGRASFPTAYPAINRRLLSQVPPGQTNATTVPNGEACLSRNRDRDDFAGVAGFLVPVEGRGAVFPGFLASRSFRGGVIVNIRRLTAVNQKTPVAAPNPGMHADGGRPIHFAAKTDKSRPQRGSQPGLAGIKVCAQQRGEGHGNQSCQIRYATGWIMQPIFREKLRNWVLEREHQVFFGRNFPCAR